MNHVIMANHMISLITSSTTDKLGDRGVVLYIHKSLTAFKVDILSDSDFSESVWCEISLRDTDKLLVGCIYRSPSSSKDNNNKIK